MAKISASDLEREIFEREESTVYKGLHRVGI